MRMCNFVCTMRSYNSIINCHNKSEICGVGLYEWKTGNQSASRRTNCTLQTWHNGWEKPTAHRCQTSSS